MQQSRLLFSALWYLIWRPVFYDYLRIRDPLHINGIDAYCDFFLKLCLTIILGAMTHIFWDGFSHDDTKNIAFKGFLAEPIVILNIHTKIAMLMQMLFSLVPLPIIFYMLYHYYLDHQCIGKKRKIYPILIIACVIGAIVFGGILIGKLMFYHAHEANLFSYSVLSESIFSFFRGFLSFLVLTLGIIRLIYIKALSLHSCSE